MRFPAGPARDAGRGRAMIRRPDCGHPRAQPGVAAEQVQATRRLRRRARGWPGSRSRRAAPVPQRAGVDRDHRQAAGHGLHGGQGLQFGLGRDGEHVRQPVQAGQVGGGHVAEEADPPGERRSRAAELAGPALVRAGAARWPAVRPRPSRAARSSSTSARFSGLSLADRQDDRRPGGQRRTGARIRWSGGPGRETSRSTPLETTWDGARRPCSRSSRSAVPVGAVTWLHRFAKPTTKE